MRFLLTLTSVLMVGACAPDHPANQAEVQRLDPEHQHRERFDEAMEDERCRGSTRVDPYSEPGAPPVPENIRQPDLPQPPGGLIYNDALARRVAFVYLTSIFGHPLAQGVLPLQARLERGIWYVQGAPAPPDAMGGTLYIQICQSNGRVLSYLGTQ
jgi:hypothetical protein